MRQTHFASGLGSLEARRPGSCTGPRGRWGREERKINAPVERAQVSAACGHRLVAKCKGRPAARMLITH
ncbi:hypothetical protein NDU88_002704 [Pleurodeles waltl]|uniref:Uncharacterized protein n=1 Tax=Pleurodeles waltl TaxID=8319 RepID=A0AAV7NIM9_PLEWA|nr:hypothetical protein NDU88_002704 [Pleurodeles waltl]